jgi:hypothetical protein
MRAVGRSKRIGQPNGDWSQRDTDLVSWPARSRLVVFGAPEPIYLLNAWPSLSCSCPRRAQYSNRRRRSFTRGTQTTKMSVAACRRGSIRGLSQADADQPSHSTGFFWFSVVISTKMVMPGHGVWRPKRSPPGGCLGAGSPSRTSRDFRRRYVWV